jgi:hypothetical protein
MKKETWILLALLGIGLFKHLMDKKKLEQPKDSSDADEIIKFIRAKHDESNGDANYVITEIQKKYNYSPSDSNVLYEQFRMKLSQEPNLGL